MNRKITILVITKIAFIILLIVNTTSIQAADRTWHAGEIYYFGESYLGNNIYSSKDLDIQRTFRFAYQNQFAYNITSVDLLTERYRAIYTEVGGGSFAAFYDFASEDFVENYLDLNNIMTFEYNWDYTKNDTVLTGLYFTLFKWSFVEPQWDIINRGFADMFNTSEIIATVADPYLPITHNITFGEFLNSTDSYTLMGKGNLQAGKDKISAKTTRWDFTFDISNALKTGPYNSTLGYTIYQPSGQATCSFELGYTDGGVLEHLEVHTFGVYNRTNDILETSMDFKLALGGLASLESNIPILMLIPTVFVTFALFMKRRKERSRKKR